MEKTEYFVYCGFFITHYWVERFAQIPKGVFLEVPCSLTFKVAPHHGRAGACPRRPGLVIELLFGCKSGLILKIRPLNDCYIAAGASPRPTLACGIRTQSNSNFQSSSGRGAQRMAEDCRCS